MNKFIVGCIIISFYCSAQQRHNGNLVWITDLHNNSRSYGINTPALELLNVFKHTNAVTIPFDHDAVYSFFRWINSISAPYIKKSIENKKLILEVKYKQLQHYQDEHAQALKALYRKHYLFFNHQLDRYDLYNLKTIQPFAEKNTFDIKTLCTYLGIARYLQSFKHSVLLAGALYYKILQSAKNRTPITGIGLVKRYTPWLIKTIQHYLLYRSSFIHQPAKIFYIYPEKRIIVQDDNDHNSYVFCYKNCLERYDIKNFQSKEPIIQGVSLAENSCITRQGLEKVAFINQQGAIEIHYLASKKSDRLTIDTTNCIKISFNPYCNAMIGLLYPDKIILYDTKKDEIIKQLATDSTDHFVFTHNQSVMWQDNENIHIYTIPTNKHSTNTIGFTPYHWHYHSVSSILALTDKTNVYFYHFENEHIKPLWFEECHAIDFFSKMSFSTDGNTLILYNHSSIFLFNIALKKSSIILNGIENLQTVVVKKNHLLVFLSNKLLRIHAPIFGNDASVDQIIKFMAKAAHYSIHLADKALSFFVKFNDTHPEYLLDI